MIKTYTFKDRVIENAYHVVVPIKHTDHSMFFKVCTYENEQNFKDEPRMPAMPNLYFFVHEEDYNTYFFQTHTVEDCERYLKEKVAEFKEE